MNDAAARLLATHGMLVLLAGLLSGFFYWLKLVQRRPEPQTRPWRVAHATLVAVGLTMAVAGLLLTRMAPSSPLCMPAAWWLVVSGWSFGFAMIGGGITGLRGLTPEPWGLNTVIFAAHALGALGSTLGIGLLAWVLVFGS